MSKINYTDLSIVVTPRVESTSFDYAKHKEEVNSLSLSVKGSVVLRNSVPFDEKAKVKAKDHLRIKVIL